MSLPLAQQARWWGIGLVILLFSLWLVSDALAPFALGAAMAYLLDPLADRLESWGLSRVMSTVIISVVFVFVAFILFIAIVPLLLDQAQQLITTLPSLVASLTGFLEEKFPTLFEADSTIRQGLAAFQDTLREKGAALVNAVLSSSLKVVDFVLLLVVAPVVGFYLLLDWDRMIAVIDSWLPREHAPVIRRLGGEIGTVLSGFIRGQMTVGLILGIFYAVSLAIIGVPFGIVVGLMAGLLTFIPYVGSTLGGITSIGLALYAFWGDWVWIIATAVVFVIGQVVEGNFLTPKLVGGSVGLHPVWLMFALYAFGSLFGFTGLLIAVPAAACIGVLGRFAIQNYKESKLYLGPEGTSEE